ncbi:tRNA (adenosine(37)-N6)-dimethylallyltransferase MiaA [soil metagenome]
MASDALVIVGATATGKTAVAVEVARRIGGEIISMDSRQLYRGMDIGTAKPTESQRGGVTHHGFDLINPDERFNAGRFAVLARAWIDGIRQRDHVPILAGGTGFFLRALTHPMFSEPDLDPGQKEEWKRYLAAFEPERLARWAANLDPDTAVRPADRQRLARVVEVAVMTGRPLSWWHRNAPSSDPAIDPMIFVLELPRDVLYQRIEKRVDVMLQQGLEREVRALLQAGYDEGAPGMNATGYIELIPCIRGERTLAEAPELVKAATRRYARRQSTWLRHQLPVGVHRLDATSSAEQLAAVITGLWREATR